MVQYVQIIVSPLIVAALILEFSGLQAVMIFSLLFAYLDQTEDRDDIRYFWDGTILRSGAIIGLIGTVAFMLCIHDPQDYTWTLGVFVSVWESDDYATMHLKDAFNALATGTT